MIFTEEKGEQRSDENGKDQRSDLRICKGFGNGSWHKRRKGCGLEKCKHRNQQR